MRGPQEIKELEAQIALDKQKYSEIDRLEDGVNRRTRLLTVSRMYCRQNGQFGPGRSIPY